jgi:hypothetical protein
LNGCKRNQENAGTGKRPAIFTLAGPATTEGATAATTGFGAIAGKTGAFVIKKFDFEPGPEPGGRTSQTNVPTITRVTSHSPWTGANFDGLDFRFMPDTVLKYNPTPETEQENYHDRKLSRQNARLR